MTLRELLVNHDRGAIEQYAKDRARSTFMGDALLCRILGTLNMYVDPRNYDMTPWLALDGYWESWITLAIGRAIQPGWNCIDAGAWCGYYAAIMGNLVGTNGSVIAFEPDPATHELCMKTQLANGFDWVESRLEAVSDQESDGFIQVTIGAGGTSLAKHGTPVRTFTLDQIQERIDLIKIDIEGGEELAWQGMQQILHRNPQCIVVMEWDARRYKDTQRFSERIINNFPCIREITTDGATAEISSADLHEPAMRYLWLQI